MLFQYNLLYFAVQCHPATFYRPGFVAFYNALFVLVSFWCFPPLIRFFACNKAKKQGPFIVAIYNKWPLFAYPGGA